MANTKDLRYVRTEKALRAAFMELVAEAPVTSVTASDVCRKASISRNAFYLHHASVADLYSALVEELVDDVRAESLASAERIVSADADNAFHEVIIASLARHEGTLRALLPSDDGSLAKRLACGIEDAFVDAALLFGAHGDSFDHRLRCAYSAWAIIGFASRWIASTDAPLTDGVENLHQLLASVISTSAHYLLNEPTAL